MGHGHAVSITVFLELEETKKQPLYEHECELGKTVSR